MREELKLCHLSLNLKRTQKLKENSTEVLRETQGACNDLVACIPW